MIRRRYLVLAVLYLAALYLFWQLGRSWNYNLAYEGLVRDTVCQQVRPEYLRRPCDGEG